jgi:AcrR family transcriptional regulator
METRTSAKKKEAPKRRSRELTTQKLFQAGLEIFSKHGYDAATTKLVAKRAGVNEALIKRYFDGKEGLLRALILDFISRSKANSEDYPPGNSLEAEIINYFETKFRYLEENHDLIRLAVSRALVDAKLNRELYKHHTPDPSERLLERLKHFQALGQIPANRDVAQLGQILNLHTMGLLFELTCALSVDPPQIRKNLATFASDFARALKAK